MSRRRTVDTSQHDRSRRARSRPRHGERRRAATVPAAELAALVEDVIAAYSAEKLASTNTSLLIRRAQDAGVQIKQLAHAVVDATPELVPGPRETAAHRLEGAFRQRASQQRRRHRHVIADHNAALSAADNQSHCASTEETAMREQQLIRKTRRVVETSWEMVPAEAENRADVEDLNAEEAEHEDLDEDEDYEDEDDEGEE